jgi:putative DNA primase/helicase
MRVSDDEIPIEQLWAGPDVEPGRDNVVALPGAQLREVSEDAIALTFTETHGTTMRFDHDVGKWYQWSTTHWRPLTVPAAFHFAREIGRKLGSGKKQICKAAVAGGAERFARADPKHAVTADTWDRDPWLLGTPKGTLNLKNGRMHSPRPEDGITKLTGCFPDSREPEMWMRFLADSTNGNPELMVYLQRVAGYCLTGLTAEHALFFIYGPGGNGKSVFLNILVHILGDYAVSAPMDTFTSSKFNSHPTELAMLKGARLVTASETEEGRAWAEARIKALTGGDPITARFMRQDFFTYQPHFKLLFAGNHQPTLTSVDPAMRRRFNMLPFIHKPPMPDHMLEEKLKEEAPRILGWALRGCLDWQKGGLGRPEIVLEATDEYFDDQDVFGQWIEERADIEIGNSGKWETAASLFGDWEKFAKTHGEHAGTSKAFGAAMRKLGLKSKPMRAGGQPQKVYQGICLRAAKRGREDEE